MIVRLKVLFAPFGVGQRSDAPGHIGDVGNVPNAGQIGFAVRGTEDWSGRGGGLVKRDRGRGWRVGLREGRRGNQNKGEAAGSK